MFTCGERVRTSPMTVTPECPPLDLSSGGQRTYGFGDPVRGGVLRAVELHHLSRRFMRFRFEPWTSAQGKSCESEAEGLAGGCTLSAPEKLERSGSRTSPRHYLLASPQDNEQTTFVVWPRQAVEACIHSVLPTGPSLSQDSVNANDTQRVPSLA